MKHCFSFSWDRMWSLFPLLRKFHCVIALSNFVFDILFVFCSQGSNVCTDDVNDTGLFTFFLFVTSVSWVIVLFVELEITELKEEGNSILFFAISTWRHYSNFPFKTIFFFIFLFGRLLSLAVTDHLRFYCNVEGQLFVNMMFVRVCKWDELWQSQRSV